MRMGNFFSVIFIFLFGGACATTMPADGYRQPGTKSRSSPSAGEWLVDANLAVGSFTHNDQNWQGSSLSDFMPILNWLQKGSWQDDEAVLQKHYGGQTLVCLIRQSDRLDRFGITKPEYLVFFLQARDQDNFSVNDYQKIQLAGINLYFSDLEKEKVFNSPTVFFVWGDQFFRLTLLYRGLARNPVNVIFNRFPWRALAH